MVTKPNSLRVSDPALICCCKKNVREVGPDDGSADGIKETVEKSDGIEDGTVDGISDEIALGS